jgi:DNA polymerase-3 subunit delta
MAASISFDTAYRQIRGGELAPVYYLTGPEEVLKDELVSLVLEGAVDPSTRDFNQDTRAAGEIDAEAFTALVDTPPMLAERRVVVVKNVEQWRKNSKVWQCVEQYVTNPSPTTVLILTHGAGQKTATSIARVACHVSVESLSPDRLVRWVKVRAERAGVLLEPDAVQHLVNVVGADLGQLGMELEKLAAAANGTAVDAERVADFVGVRRGETLLDWVNAVVSRDTTGAVAMLPAVLGTSGATGVRLVTFLGTALIMVKLARTLFDNGASTGRVERAVFSQFRAARLYAVQNWKKTAAEWTGVARRWSSDELESAIRSALDADRALKSTTIADETGILTDMVLRMSTRKAAA